MEEEQEKIPLHVDNKVYEMKDFVPKFILDIQEWFRKTRLKMYKNKKIKESKTRHYRMYHIKFHLHIDDEYNPYLSEHEYEMVVPARAAYFAKKNLEKAIKEKIGVKVSEIEEMTEEEYETFKETEDEYAKKNLD